MTAADEMWRRRVEHQPFADEHGYGADWMIMCKTRKPKAVTEAAWAAWAVWHGVSTMWFEWKSFKSDMGFGRGV